MSDVQTAESSPVVAAPDAGQIDFHTPPYFHTPTHATCHTHTLHSPHAHPYTMPISDDQNTSAAYTAQLAEAKVLVAAAPRGKGATVAASVAQDTPPPLSVDVELDNLAAPDVQLVVKASTADVPNGE